MVALTDPIPGTEEGVSGGHHSPSRDCFVDRVSTASSQ